MKAMAVCGSMTISSLLLRRYDNIIAPVAAFQKLEQYNEMIGAPRLMLDARFEFVPITILI